jgi:quercetin dioxygenase-like cupin family protein
MRKTMLLMCLAAALGWSQDPLKVASGQYKLLAENDEVRILEGDLGVGVKTVMHSHPDVMALILEPGATKWTAPDGKSTTSAAGMKRGTVIAMPAATHISENVGKTPLKTVIIEFKKPAPAAGKARKASSVPSCHVIAESPHATAQLCSGAVGAPVAEHTHLGNAVYVALTSVHAELTDSKGQTHKLDLKKDAVSIAPPGTHSGKNVGTAPYKLIVVDLK